MAASNHTLCHSYVVLIPSTPSTPFDPPADPDGNLRSDKPREASLRPGSSSLIRSTALTLGRCPCLNARAKKSLM